MNNKINAKIKKNIENNSKKTAEISLLLTECADSSEIFIAIDNLISENNKLISLIEKSNCNNVKSLIPFIKTTNSNFINSVYDFLSLNKTAPIPIPSRGKMIGKP